VSAAVSAAAAAAAAAATWIIWVRYGNGKWEYQKVEQMKPLFQCVDAASYCQTNRKHRARVRGREGDRERQRR
jgi:hypothetical protein